MDSHRSFINNYNQYKRIYARDKCSNREIIGVTKTYFIAQKCKKKNTAGGNELMFHC